MKQISLFLLLCIVASLKMPDKGSPACKCGIQGFYYKKGRLIHVQQGIGEIQTLTGAGVAQYPVTVDGKDFKPDSIVFKSKFK